VRSFCKTIPKTRQVAVGVDGTVKGWPQDFYESIGLGDLTKDNYKRIGGVDRVLEPLTHLRLGYNMLIPLGWQLFKRWRSGRYFERKGWSRARTSYGYCSG
jgi:hypothetical protein